MSWKNESLRHKLSACGVTTKDVNLIKSQHPNPDVSQSYELNKCAYETLVKKHPNLKFIKGTVILDKKTYIDNGKKEHYWLELKGEVIDFALDTFKPAKIVKYIKESNIEDTKHPHNVNKLKASVNDYVDINGRVGILTKSLQNVAIVRFSSGFEASYSWGQINKKTNQRNAEIEFKGHSERD
jgi:hypothetical protein